MIAILALSLFLLALAVAGGLAALFGPWLEALADRLL